MSESKFELCKTCGKHGRIVAADGFYSSEVWSQAFARHMVEVGIQYDTLKSTDAHVLFRQIKSSGLPVRDEEADDATKRMVNTWNAARAQTPGDNTSPDEIHTILEQADRMVDELQKMGPGFKILDLRKQQ